MTCNGFTDGTANLNISSGTSPYTEDWGTYNPTSLRWKLHIILLLILMVVVSQISVIIYEPNTFSFNVITTDVSCNGSNDGTS